MIEIRSPGDETYEKLPSYADLGVREILVIDRDTLAIEMFRGRDGVAVPVAPSPNGAVRSEVLGFELQPVDTTRIQLRRGEGEPVDVVVP